MVDANALSATGRSISFLAECDHRPRIADFREVYPRVYDPAVRNLLCTAGIPAEKRTVVLGWVLGAYVGVVLRRLLTVLLVVMAMVRERRRLLGLRLLVRWIVNWFMGCRHHHRDPTRIHMAWRAVESMDESRSHECLLMQKCQTNPMDLIAPIS